MSTKHEQSVARSTPLLAAMSALLLIVSAGLFFWCPTALYLIGGMSLLQWYWRRKKKLEANAVITTWQKLLSDINTKLAKLYDTELRALEKYDKQVGGFAGETLSQYQNARADFSEVTAWIGAAEQQLDAAKKHACHCVFPLMHGFRKAVDLLTNTPVTMAIFKSLVSEGTDPTCSLAVKKTCEPGKLAELTSELFERIGKTAASIMSPAGNAREIHESIAKQVCELKEALSRNGLPPQTYQKWFAEIEAGNKPFCDRDPVGSLHVSSQLASALPELKAKVEKLIALKSGLTLAESEIEKAERYVREVRGRNICYSYALQKDQKAPEAAKDEVFRLDEPGNNPDPSLDQARTHLKAASAALGEGNLEQAIKEKEAAISSSQDAHALVDKVLRSKQHVEKLSRENQVELSLLQTAVRRAEKQLADLKTDLPTSQFAAQEEHLESSRRSIAEQSQKLDSFKQAYDRQHYCHADDGFWLCLFGLNSHVKFELHWLLNRYCQDLCVMCKRKVSALNGKICAEAFAISAAVDGEYRQLKERLTRLTQSLNHRSLSVLDLPDWPALAQQVDSLSGSLDSLDSLIDEQCRLCAIALEVAKTSRRAFELAQIKANRAGLSQYDPASIKLRQAGTILVDAEQMLKVPKSNWAVVISLAKQAESYADEAMKLAGVEINSP